VPPSASEARPPERSETLLRFGKYQLLRLLARGGMGEVYLARLVGELGFEKQLVIKTILPELAAKPHFIELFAAEAKTAVALSHGNIVPIYELGRHQDTFYIVMGHVDGPSVAQILAARRAQGRPADYGIALHILRGVLTGLAYAHTAEPGRAAVVHRDISPRNVLIDRSGQVRLVDFGIALPTQVRTTMRAGSTGYTAPEQARAEAADPRADVFSAACLLYELVGQRRAFPTAGVWTPPAFEGIPEHIATPLRDALALDPDDRPADAAEFLECLGPAMAQHAATFGDPMLAAHLRVLFPSGWDDRTKPATAGEISRAPGDGVALGGADEIESQTFATRLTAITNVEQGLAASFSTARGDTLSAQAVAGSGHFLPALDPPTPASSLRSGGTWRRPLALLVTAAVAGGTVAWLLSRGDASPSVLPAPVAPQEAPAPEVVAIPGAPHAMGPVVPATDQPRMHTFAVRPTDATVHVDGELLVGAPPFVIRLSPEASVEVTVHKEGFEPHTALLHHDAGELPAEIVLEKSPPRQPGYLRVSAPSVPWAEVRIDGRKIGDTPTRKVKLPAGSHDLEVRCIPDACPTTRVLLRKRIRIEPDDVVTIRASG
jgi:serine/threonine-protein kinase